MSGRRTVALAACAYAGSLCLFEWGRSSELLTVAVVSLAVFGFLLTWSFNRLASSWLEFPEPEDAEIVGSRLIKYPTAFSARHLVAASGSWVVLVGTVVPLILLLASLPMLAGHPPVEVIKFVNVVLFIILPVFVLFLLGPTVALLLSFPFPMPLKVEANARGVRVRIFSLLEHEAELISDGEVEVSGFREFGSYPVDPEVSPGPRSGLRIRVGYFEPGLRDVEVRDCGFVLLRTRGFCLLYDSSGLPGDREEAFRLARRWEKFSMVYAALCLRHGDVPDREEVERWLDRVKNNRSTSESIESKEYMVIRYMGCEDWRPNPADVIAAFFKVTVEAGMTLGLPVFGLYAWFVLTPAYLEHHLIRSVGLIIPASLPYLIWKASYLTRYHRWLVGSGAVYEALFEGRAPREEEVMDRLDEWYRSLRSPLHPGLPRWPRDDQDET